MADRAGAPRGAVSQAAQRAPGSRCWRAFLVWFFWSVCVPALGAAQDDVSPSIMLPKAPGFEVIKVPSLVTVPDVRRHPWDKAKAVLHQYGLTTQEFPLFRDSTKPDNTVIDQDPGPGAKVKRGTSVTLTVSRQKRETPVSVPDVLRRSWQEAKAILDRSGLGTQEFPRFRDSTEPDNRVIDQTPRPGTKVKRGSVVTLTVSRQALPEMELSLSGPGEVRQGTSATYSARLSRQVPGASTRYRFSVGNRAITGWIRAASVGHLFADAGTTSVGAEARVVLGEQQKVLRAPAKRVRVKRRQPPEISISPESRRVEQGASVSFSARIRAEMPVDLVWDGPGGAKRGVKNYAVDTRRLSPGSHRVTLTAHAKGFEAVVASARLIVDERLVAVPDVRGLSWDRAKAILHQPEYALGTQEFPLVRETLEPDNRVVDQDPEPGAKVKRGTSVRLTVSRQALPEFELRLAGPDRVPLGESRTYSARLSRQVPGADVEYRFYVGTKPITGWIRADTVEHLFDGAGTTSVIAEARVVLNEQSRTARASVPQVRVVAPPPPVVRISPHSERIEQGSTVSFTGQVEAEMPVDLVWDGPAGETRGVDTYRVDTSRVPVGNHPITLTAHARWLDPVTGYAELTVEEPYRPPQARIENLRPRVAIGEPVELEGRYTIDPRHSPDLHWRGAWGTRDRVETLTMDSARLGLGRHAFEFAVSDGRETARDNTTVEVYTALDPPLARLDPPQAEVMQGDPVSFLDVSPRDNRGELAATWLPPAGDRRGGRRLELDTADLAVGTHQVALRLDGPFGRSDTATAPLHITPAYRPPRAGIDPPGGYRVEQGEQVVFSNLSQTDGRLPFTLSWAGPADVQGGADRVRIDTAALEPGDYEVFLAVRDSRGEDRARAPLTVVAPPPLPELRIEPPLASAIRGDRVDFAFAVTPPDAVVQAPTWAGPRGGQGTGAAFAVATRHLPPGRHDIRLVAQDDRQRPVSAVASLEVRDPVVALSVDRPELPPGDPVVFTPRVTPELPGAVFWYRIDGEDRLRRVDAGMPLSHRFPEVGTYSAVFIAERDGLRWESPPVQVVVDVLIWPQVLRWLPWLAALAVLAAGGALALRRLRPRAVKPVRAGVRFETAVRVDPDETRSGFGPYAAEMPDLALAVVTDRGTQAVMETEEQDGESGNRTGA